MTNTPELEYFTWVYEGFLAFQAGAGKIPVAPVNARGAEQIYKRAMLAAAEELVLVQNKKTGESIEYLRSMDGFTSNPLFAYATYFNMVAVDSGKKLVTSHALLDTDRNGNLRYGRGLDHQTIEKDYTETYTAAVAQAMAVDRVLQQYNAGKTADPALAKVDVAGTTAELIKQHGAEAYANGGFTHVYGKITERLSSALGRPIALPPLEDEYKRQTESHLKQVESRLTQAASQLKQEHSLESVLRLQLAISGALENKVISDTEKKQIEPLMSDIIAQRKDLGGTFAPETQQRLDEALKKLEAKKITAKDKILGPDITELQGHGLPGKPIPPVAKPRTY